MAANLRWFLKSAAIVRKAVPAVSFAIASFKPQQAEMARKMVAETDLAAEVYVGKTPELIRLADCCMAVSGSVSLELLYQMKPTVILYWINRAAYFVQRFFRKVKYITLVNLLAADELYPKDLTPFDPSQPDAAKVLFPEYLTCEDRSGQIASHVIEWLTEPSRRNETHGEAGRVEGPGRPRRRLDTSGRVHPPNDILFLIGCLEFRQPLWACEKMGTDTSKNVCFSRFLDDSSEPVPNFSRAVVPLMF